MESSKLTYDLLIGEGPFKTFNRTLKAPLSVVKGEVLGYLPATSSVTPYDSGGAGGEEIFYAIAVEDTDASAGDKAIAVYVGGEFRIPGLTFTTTGDIADEAFVNEARALGVYLKPSTDVDGS